MEMKDMTLSQFSERTASGESAPGGGSVSAMAGAFAAALSAMVARLTEGKKGFEAAAPEMRRLIETADGLRLELLSDIQRDSASFEAFMRATALPRATDAEKTARKAAMQAALRHAAEIPLSVAEKAAGILPCAQAAVSRGNPNAVTDALVSAMLARAAVRGALMNVKINLLSIQDEAYVRAMRARCAQLDADAQSAEAAILALRPDLT